MKKGKPDKTDHNAKILDVLRERGTRGIVSDEADDLGFHRLQARLGELREDGWTILSLPSGRGELTRYVLDASVPLKPKKPVAAGIVVQVMVDGEIRIRPQALSLDPERAERLAADIRRFMASGADESDDDE